MASGLLASAGAASLVVGLALQPMLKNLIAGVQLAITQPIRIDDALFVNDEWGNVEEITSSYVVIRLWDWRRMIVPLSYFIEQPFQNWTRERPARQDCGTGGSSPFRSPTSRRARWRSAQLSLGRCSSMSISPF